ncbi:MAG: hypothetical protein CM15mP74_27810 [Halieaceae bacterium]|nr:MAG: hypothetical protein CM15mP74_27810 [Halieaceae bacterium]
MTEAVSKPFFEDLEVGMRLPTVELGPMDRFDYIPIALILETPTAHLDRVYAQERGLHDVVQQGPSIRPICIVTSPRGSRPLGSGGNEDALCGQCVSGEYWSVGVKFSSWLRSRTVAVW